MDNTISLYGGLARAFQKRYNYSPKNISIKAKTVKDVMSALEANFPGFRTLLKKAGYYRVANGVDLYNGHGIDENEVEMKFGTQSWHIMPVAAGCGAVARIVLGVVLIVVGVIYPPLGFLVSVGVGFIVGGVAELLAPSPASNAGEGEKPNERPSYLFDGPRNTVEPGLTIPVVYGESFIGSITVSGGIRVMNMSSDIVEATEEPDSEPPEDTSSKYDSGDSSKWGDTDGDAWQGGGP
jgi:predicted phage tail protein